MQVRTSGSYLYYGGGKWQTYYIYPQGNQGPTVVKLIPVYDSTYYPATIIEYHYN